MSPEIPRGWKTVLEEEITKAYYQNLQSFLGEERKQYQIFPPEHEIFSALKFTPYTAVSVLLLGQDPYHGQNQAHGLSFSVRPGTPLPPSLKNIFKELNTDLGIKLPNHGCLLPWAKQGVLLLNAVLTVRAHQPNSHKGKGWEIFTDKIIRSLSNRDDPVVFLLWGSFAHKKIELINTQRHTIIQSAHPSPFSAHRGFFGSRPFSRTNRALKESGKPEIDWQIAEPKTHY
jgi:uracil-DNA glycosylase